MATVADRCCLLVLDYEIMAGWIYQKMDWDGGGRLPFPISAALNSSTLLVDYAKITGSMNRQKTSHRRSSGNGTAACRVKTSSAGLRLTSTLHADAVSRQKYRELIRKHLGQLLDSLFAEFTGLHFHIAWAPTLPKQWDARTLPTGLLRLLPDKRLAPAAGLPDLRANTARPRFERAR